MLRVRRGAGLHDSEVTVTVGIFVFDHPCADALGSSRQVIDVCKVFILARMGLGLNLPLHEDCFLIPEPRALPQVLRRDLSPNVCFQGQAAR